MKSPNHLDLGLCISEHHSTFGVPRTSQSIANYCTWDPTKKIERTISRQRIEQISERALRKIRAHLYRNPELREELAGLFGLK
jgi:hypothetical protein